MKIFFSNVPFSMNEIQVKGLFEDFGPVHSVDLVEKNGRRAGYGFIVMNWREGVKAVRALHLARVGGRTLHVCEALPKAERETTMKPYLIEDKRNGVTEYEE